MKRIDLSNLAETVDIKIKLTEAVGGKEFIQFFPFVRRDEPDLFDTVVKAVEDSLNKQCVKLESDIKAILKHR